MTYSTIQASPSRGTVGEPVELVATLPGTSTPDSGTNPPVRYWYVQSAPASSKLRTLDQLKVLQDFHAGLYAFYTGPLPRGIERKALRLEAKGPGATFTPDVPGQWTLRLYDITEYHFAPVFGGQVPGAGEDTFASNELAALPGYVSPPHAQAPTLTLTFWVEETKRRKIGISPDTAEVVITGFNLLPDSLRDDAVALTPGGTPAAGYAAQDNDVLAAVDTIRTGSLSLAVTCRTISWTTVIDAWNAHLGYHTNYLTHHNADTHFLATATCADLATAIAMLNDIRAKYELHRVTAAGVVHDGADASNVITVAACTDHATAISLWSDLWLKINRHAIVASDVGVHPAAPTSPVDGSAKSWAETPRPGSVSHLVAQTNRLAAFYAQHQVRTANLDVHSVADAENPVKNYVPDSTATQIEIVNQWANSIERHAKNQKADGSPAGVAYHNNSPGYYQDLTIPFRAHDAESSQRLFELCLVVMELHMLSGDVVAAGGVGTHRSNAWGKHGCTEGVRTFLDATNAYMARLARAWWYATNGAAVSAPAPEFSNSAFAKLASGAGWTLRAPDLSADGVQRHLDIDGLDRTRQVRRRKRPTSEGQIVEVDLVRIAPQDNEERPGSHLGSGRQGKPYL